MKGAVFNEKHYAFILGVGVSIIILVTFFTGALADRIFVIRPLDLLARRTPTYSLETINGTKPTIGEPPTSSNVGQPNSVVDVADKASESVVTVSIKRQANTSRMLIDPFGTQFGFGPFGGMQQLPNIPSEPKQQDIGSGFVVENTGLVVTNKHVVVDPAAEYFIVDRHDKQHKVSKIYRDPTNDLAILKVDDLQVNGLVLGDSNQLRVGESVIAIGTALGEFRHTVTTGVISGLGRGIEAGNAFGGQSESLENVIQTDAAINPGNSGGPLLDISGRVIGINTAVSSQGQNIGFALPINIIKQSIENFNKTGQFDRPALGVRYRMIPEQAALFNSVPQGAYVVEVLDRSSAKAAGLQVGDIITSLDGQSLKKSDLAKLINQKKIGDRVTLKYWRDDTEKVTDITLQGQD